MAKILMFNKFDLNINYINYINMSRNYISKQLLTSSINIPTDRLRGDINETILRQIKKRFEGTCNQDGFIEKDSIEITNRSLGEMKTAGQFVEQKSIIIATYILCGFANFASIGIQIGGIGALSPKRKGDLARLGFLALIGGTLASLFTAVIVGMIL